MDKCTLILDDDQEILFVCKTILEKQNYRVETRIRCDNIIEDARLLKPELILIDLRIPEMGGERAVKLLKGTNNICNIPAILFPQIQKLKRFTKDQKPMDF